MVNICLQQPVEELCSIRNFEKCTIAKVTNDYEITYVLKNKQLLFVSKRSKKIIEDCQGILTTHEAQWSNLLSSPCKLLIGASTYSNTIPVYNISTPNIASIPHGKQEFEVQLELRHFESPNQLRIEAQEIKPVV